ncbi:MAG TPA: chemotaxis protein CheD [Chryseolinea sp.]
MTSLRKYTIFAGQSIITSAPALISTVLGSCVSVCLLDRETGVAGVNHFLLPGIPSDEIDDLNRGLTSTSMLIRSVLNRNARIDTLQAKVFGGCNSLYRNDIFKVGERNIAIALAVLKSFDVPVLAKHVGGNYGRKIIFNTATGRVRVKLLTKNATELNEEIDKGFGY